MTRVSRAWGHVVTCHVRRIWPLSVSMIQIPETVRKGREILHHDLLSDRLLICCSYFEEVKGKCQGVRSTLSSDLLV